MTIINLHKKNTCSKEKIVILLCFAVALCFNILMVFMAIYNLFTYDGGAEDAKVYYEIRDIETAHSIFLRQILMNLLYGLLFAFPLVISWLFVRKIGINAIMFQLLPILVILGQIMFF